jgi:hypothetical protein
MGKEMGRGCKSKKENRKQIKGTGNRNGKRAEGRRL